MASRRNYYILILKCVFSLREIYSTGIVSTYLCDYFVCFNLIVVVDLQIEFAKNVIQDSLIHFTYYTHASNVRI